MSTRRLEDIYAEVRSLADRYDGLRQIVERLQRTGTSTGWQPIALANSWVNFGGSRADARARREPGGVIRLDGAVKSGTTTNATVLGTTPVGLRPTIDVDTLIMDNTDAGRITIRTDGTIEIYGVSQNTLVSLTGITFAA